MRPFEAVGFSGAAAMPKRRRGSGGELVTTTGCISVIFCGANTSGHYRGKSVSPRSASRPTGAVLLTRHTVNSAQHRCPPLLLQLLCSPCCLLRLHALQLLLAHPTVSPIAFLNLKKPQHIEPFCVFSSAPTVDILMIRPMCRLNLCYIWSNSITDLFCSCC